MATIENLGTAFLRHYEADWKVGAPAPRPDSPPFVEVAGAKSEKASSPPELQRRRAEAPSPKPDEAQLPRESSIGRDRANETPRRPRHKSFAEFAEMLRKVNIRLDLFEIQMKFTVNHTSGDVLVEVIDQRTGEVIRRIPPYEVIEIAESLVLGGPVITDVEA